MGGHLGLCLRWLWLELGSGKLPLKIGSIVLVTEAESIMVRVDGGDNQLAFT